MKQNERHSNEVPPPTQKIDTSPLRNSHHRARPYSSQRGDAFVVARSTQAIQQHTEIKCVRLYVGCVCPSCSFIRLFVVCLLGNPRTLTHILSGLLSTTHRKRDRSGFRTVARSYAQHIAHAAIEYQYAFHTITKLLHLHTTHNDQFSDCLETKLTYTTQRSILVWKANNTKLHVQHPISLTQTKLQLILA